jgi:hypothetical protein
MSESEAPEVDLDRIVDALTACRDTHRDWEAASDAAKTANRDLVDLIDGVTNYSDAGSRARRLLIEAVLDGKYVPAIVEGHELVPLQIPGDTEDGQEIGSHGGLVDWGKSPAVIANVTVGHGFPGLGETPKGEVFVELPQPRTPANKKRKPVRTNLSPAHAMQMAANLVYHARKAGQA